MTVTALITAAEGFPALERVVFGAEDEVLMSFRVFDPETRLRHPEVVAEGLETWADLLGAVTRRGVRLRLMHADFDALFTERLHEAAWANATGFAEAVAPDAQVLCAPHGQRAGKAWRVAMAKTLRDARARIAKKDPETLTPVQKRVLEKGAELRPVTVHQKFAVIDSRTCIIGGLDVDERRFDTPRHDRHPAETWHDISARVTDGDFARALRGHFAQCWNMALDAGAASLAAEATRMTDDPLPQSRADLRVLRTLSRPAKGATRLAPDAIATEHEAALLALFGEARRYIYAETQFLRHRPLVDALVAAGGRATDLQLMVVLPAAPERVLFDGDDGWNARHAHWLQVNAIDRLREAFGARFSALTPAQRSEPPSDSPRVEGAGPIYVHSKVLITDDAAAVIGSANLNGRSMRWDTEASVLVRDAGFARDLFDRLAAKWMENASASRNVRLARSWEAHAADNARRAPETRLSPLLPFPQDRSRRFSRRFWLLPDDMF